MAEYDKKNQELYDENTEKIWVALDAIRNDKNLKATKGQVATLTGLHRNTFKEQGARGWVSLELDVIVRQRKEDSKHIKITKKQQEENLQDLLEQSKLEILHWFTLYSESERELTKLRKRFKDTSGSLEWYKEELSKERKVLQERVELLESLLSKSEG
ncbi:hypothetical protein BCU71_17580 [Vibrio lentus]|uniref:Exonuclease SbcC n=1 Tax=Vibrio pomeroyi TaxID=198832 RepID=A0ABV4N1T6_9VIBR|nr:hypothetical protein [Vibrio lentus]PMH16151.1 hypothetical protein BCU76_12150 [Vibrio lentus]PMH29136.1 hypothetical protein BCU71_17580 [Vibrio lentus]PMK67691.1 hypothetical protein BCT93_20445 [Vibrio lentus]